MIDVCHSNAQISKRQEILTNTVIRIRRVMQAHSAFTSYKKITETISFRKKGQKYRNDDRYKGHCKEKKQPSAIFFYLQDFYVLVFVIYVFK